MCKPGSDIWPALFLAFFCCDFTLLPGVANAQFIFQNFNQKDGLSGNHVRCLYQDKQGFVWVGTANGLNRYDGHLVQRFKSKSGQKDFFVEAIYPIDDDTNLLVATPFGIQTFSKRLGVYIEDKRFGKLKGKVVQAIHEDNQKRLWLVSYTEIFVYVNGEVLSAFEVMQAAKNFEGTDFGWSSFAAFCWDPKRVGFWVGGTNAFFIDCRNNTIYHKDYNPHKYPLLDYSNIISIALTRSGDLWFSTRFDAVLGYWNHADNSVKEFRQLDEDPLTLGANLLFIDSRERLWISTYMASAYYKLPGQPIRRIRHSQNEPNSIGYGYFRDAFEDREGNVWLATLNGVSKSLARETVTAIYNLPSFPYFQNVSYAPTNSIVVKDSTVAAAKEDGVVMYNMNNNRYSTHAVTRMATEIKKNHFLVAAKGRDRVWFGGENGIYYIKNGTNEFKKFETIKTGTPGKVTSFVYEDTRGFVWFFVYGDALYRHDPVAKSTQRIEGKKPDWDAYPQYSSAPSCLELRNGNILFFYNKVGLVVYHAATGQFSYFPIHNVNDYHFLGAVEDRQGYIWSCVWGYGLIKMNTRGDVLDSLNTSNGLMSDYPLSVDIDSRGLIWTASKEGLIYFDPKTKEVTRVDVGLGKAYENHWLTVKTVDEKVYAAMLDQVVVFNPTNFAAITVKEPPHITYVKVYGKDNTNTKTLTDISEVPILELSPDQDFIELHFASLNHNDIPSLVYSYKLEGQDDDWIYAGRNTIVNYNNLRPGTYTFKVRSIDENGNWMTKVRSFTIIVLPHWWQTWWFISVIAILAGFAVFLIYRSRLKRKRKDGFEKTIDYFANSVYGENSVSEICWDIARNCISQLYFEDCVVYLWDHEKEKLVQKAAYGSKNVREHEIDNPIELRLGEGIVGTAAATRKTIIVNDTSKDDRYVVDDEIRLSEISVPIMHEGQVLGVIDSEHSRKNFFSQEHARTLFTIASISANKIAEAQAEEAAQQKEMMLLEINKMLAESQLMALRAQMNPHFVFNCLNSIQECIVTEKYDEASKYLNKFSKLFRMVLHNSDKNFVTIEEEQEVLELYLELEQMRFEQSFSYEIFVDERLESEEIVLPSMLLQPFVENALWHGLMHKKGDRNISVRFEKINDELFRCLVEDNGIGRKKSFEIKEFNSKAKRHKSKGLQIVRDRLNLLERQGMHASVDMTDKYDPAGRATGTLITIELSTFLNHI